jgi:diadenosine tetraphosphate (Ap4A) HIT family hydrolase
MTELHTQLAADCIILGRFPLCHLLLAKDANYPWFILVPDRDNIGEIYHLATAERRQLLDESCRLSEYLMRSLNGDKLNVAALGNRVPQLHLHHIVRFESDPAWPDPVWGKYPPLPYSSSALVEIRSDFNEANLDGFKPDI